MFCFQFNEFLVVFMFSGVTKKSRILLPYLLFLLRMLLSNPRIPVFLRDRRDSLFSYLTYQLTTVFLTMTTQYQWFCCWQIRNKIRWIQVLCSSGRSSRVASLTTSRNRVNPEGVCKGSEPGINYKGRGLYSQLGEPITMRAVLVLIWPIWSI